MALIYGDSVVLIQRSPDGTIRRVNAIVLASHIQSANATRFNGLRDSKGGLLPEGEYLDLAFPRTLPQGQSVKANDMGSIFQPSYATAPWKDGATIGWQKGSATEVVPDPLPSAADLDADAEEKQAKDATADKPKGKLWGKPTAAK